MLLFLVSSGEELQQKHKTRYAVNVDLIISPENSLGSNFRVKMAFSLTPQHDVEFFGMPKYSSFIWALQRTKLPLPFI